jgi:hypothetical protein
MPAAPTVNEQVIEAVVSGPHGANRLYTCTGHALIPMGASPNETKRETWTFLVGPGFPNRSSVGPPRPRLLRVLESRLKIQRPTGGTT